MFSVTWVKFTFDNCSLRTLSHWKCSCRLKGVFLLAKSCATASHGCSVSLLNSDGKDENSSRRSVREIATSRDCIRCEFVSHRRNLVCCIFTESMPKIKAIWKLKIPASFQFILHRTRKSISVDILLENMQISNHVWCQQLLLKHWIAGTVYPLFKQSWTSLM